MKDISGVVEDKSRILCPQCHQRISYDALDFYQNKSWELKDGERYYLVANCCGKGLFLENKGNWSELSFETSVGKIRSSTI